MLRKFMFVAIALSLAPAAMAEVKVYNSNSPASAGGTRIGVFSNLCPTTQTTPGALRGQATLTDDGLGTVTMTELVVTQPALINIDTTGAFGPGAFIFIEGNVTSTPTQGQTGTGSTAPAGSVSWGIISGWSVTGATFCTSSPGSTCTDNGFALNITVEPDQPSTTYDMGTWSFDAAGDYTAPPYVQRTSNGGIANTQWELRGTFTGAALPALPLVGFGALAIGLAVVGGRSLMRKK